MDERQRRVGENEILFRDVNERLRAVSEGFSMVLPELELVCECGDTACVERLTMTIEEYEQLRSNPTHFAVKPGHEAADVEAVVERRGRYDVIEKHVGEESDLAAQHDPRA